jgi:hypothetical protein
VRELGINHLASPTVGEDPATTRRLLDFELALDAAVSERLVETEWGRAFLSPGLELIGFRKVGAIQVLRRFPT